MLYERNEIVEIREENNKKGVYASFPCEEDNSYDYLLLEDIPNIVFIPEFIQSYKNARIKECNISFTTKYDPNDPYNIKLTASANDTHGESVIMDLQAIVDKLCLSAYELMDLDEYQEIQELKSNAINSVASKLLEGEGILISNKYDFMGKIIDKQNNVVGIIDSFDIKIENENYITVNLNKVVSYFALKDIEVKAIKFPTGRNVLEINDFEIIESDEGILRNYVLKAKIAFTSEDSSQELLGIGRQFINDPETFFDNRAQLLTSKEEIFKQDDIKNTVSDLFDDFEL